MYPVSQTMRIMARCRSSLSDSCWVSGRRWAMAASLGDDALVAAVLVLLLGAQGDEVVAVGALRQFGFHLRLAAAQHAGA
jgi:hypothetical protein